MMETLKHWLQHYLQYAKSVTFYLIQLDWYKLLIDNPIPVLMGVLFAIYFTIVLFKRSNAATKQRKFKNEKVLSYIGGENNPFVQRGVPWSHPMEIYKTILLLPLGIARICLFCATLAFAGLFIVYPSATGLSDQDSSELKVPEPIKGWRRYLITRLQPVMRVLMFAMGYHHIRVEGTVDKRAGTIVSNHCSFLDPFILMNYVTPMFVAAAENLQKPLFGPYLRVTQSIVLYRSDPNSRAYTKYNIMERTKPERGDDFLPLMIFPEGTTHAQDCLLQFKDGAFRPGTPVQPAILKYSNRRYDPAWTISGDTLGALMARCFFQFYNSVTVKFLPLYIPNEEEKKDPYLYANNVRNYMAAEGHMELTPTWLEDANLFRKALHLNAVGCNLLCKEVTDHATRKKLASLLADFSKMDTNNDGLLDYNEFMTAVVPKGNKKDRVAAITLFNIMDKDGSDSIDFKEFVAGLYMNSNEKSDDVDSKVEFVFSVYGLDKMSEISQEHAIDVLVKHHPLLPREAIVDKVQSAWKGIERDVAATITMEEFAHLVTADKDIYTYSLPAALQKAMTE